MWERICRKEEEEEEDLKVRVRVIRIYYQLVYNCQRKS